MFNKSLLILLSSVTLLSACAQQPSQPTPAQQVSASTPSKAVGLWIDVRTPEEYAQGHLQDAVNIPVEQIASKISEVTTDKNAPIHVYCRSGRRSEIALQELRKLGYTQVTNQGGYQDLIQKGLK